MVGTGKYPSSEVMIKSLLNTESEIVTVAVRRIKNHQSGENLIEKIGKILNKKIKYRIKKNRIRPKKSEVMRLLASNKKAKKLLGWKPKFNGHNGFNKGLEETIRWLTNKNNLSSC